MEISMEHSLDDIHRRKLNSWEKMRLVYHIVTRTGLESNPVLCGERPATNRLNHGKVF
jgi:hypothetical protein